MNDEFAIVQAVREYATAYSRLQELQYSSELLPPGDQKTGCVGEFFAHLFLRETYPGATIIRGGHSNKAWDFELRNGAETKRIQVKTVSAYAIHRTLSPVHHGWDELFLMYLGKDLMPLGFWIITDNSIVGEGEVLKNLKCCTPDGKKASKILPVGENRIETLLSKLTTLFESS